MTFATVTALVPDDVDDVVRAARDLRRRLDGPPEVVFMFGSTRLGDVADELASAVMCELDPATMLGNLAAGVIGDRHEIERAPAVVLMAGTGLGLTGRAAHVEHLDVDGGSFLGIPEIDPATGTMLVIADPYSFGTDEFFTSLGHIAPGVNCIGGLASGGTRDGAILFADGKVYPRGAVVLALPTTVASRTIVSQGCRPIGSPLVVTNAEANVVLELAGKPAVDRLVEVIDSLGDEDRDLLSRGGLHVGIVIDEHRVDFAPGDFLIRGVVGLDRTAKAIGVGDIVPVGATVQFHVRDAVTADAELNSMLTTDAGPDPAAALLFTCNGRGRNLFGRPDHDTRAIRSRYGEIPVAGFFASGEIGPVGGQNFMHGFTASTALLTLP